MGFAGLLGSFQAALLLPSFSIISRGAAGIVPTTKCMRLQPLHPANAQAQELFLSSSTSWLVRAICSLLVPTPGDSFRIFIIRDTLCRSIAERDKMQLSLSLIILKGLNSVYKLPLTSLCCLKNPDKMPGGATREMMNAGSQRFDCF